MKNRMMFRSSMFLLLGAALLWSCSKKESENINVNTEKGAFALEIIIGGVTENEGNNDALGESAANNLKMSKTEVMFYEQNRPTSFSAQMSVNELESKANKPIVASTQLDNSAELENKNKQGSKKTSVATLSALPTAQLEANKTFRLLIYNSKNVLVHDQQFTMPTGGGKLSATISTGNKANSEIFHQGDTYTWYAFSYNDNSNLSTIALDAVTPTLPVPANPTSKDLLFATDKIVGPINQKNVTSVPLNIIFKHQNSRLNILLDVQKLSLVSSITTGKVRVDPSAFDVGSFDIKNGKFINVTPAGTPGTSLEGIFDKIPTSKLPTQKSAFFYSVTPKTLTNFKVTIASLELKKKDSFTLTSSAAGSTFTFNSVTMPTTTDISKIIRISLADPTYVFPGCKPSMDINTAASLGVFAFTLSSSSPATNAVFRFTWNGYLFTSLPVSYAANESFTISFNFAQNTAAASVIQRGDTWRAILTDPIGVEICATNATRK